MSNQQQINLTKFTAELVGTAIFLTIILKSGGDKYVIVLGLLAAILFMGSVSGGHFNPAVTIMKFVQNINNPNSKDHISGVSAMSYIIAQTLGGIAAIKLAEM